MKPQFDFPRTENSDVREWLKQADKNFEALQEQDRQAKEAGILVGRFIQEQFADGYAYYVVTKENKKMVRINAVSGMGDDWRIPYWGEETNIEKSYLLDSISRREDLAKLFQG